MGTLLPFISLHNNDENPPFHYMSQKICKKDTTIESLMGNECRRFTESCAWHVACGENSISVGIHTVFIYFLFHFSFWVESMDEVALLALYGYGCLERLSIHCMYGNKYRQTIYHPWQWGPMAACSYWSVHQVHLYSYVAPGIMELRSLPDNSTHDQECESNLRPFDVESNTLSSRSYVPGYSILRLNATERQCGCDCILGMYQER